ncbi:Calcineurin-like phosphoesterase [Alkalibacterium putridalgicola]|uniref:Calcineurin-like phosphoesterase n=1 Tax=Alkalibacterium putridalgicola TaxID=426703 RepID=A0A1H7UDU1_9LACT|nr:metallophosphoesterase family protein [Alkalibacterium putridalgicola]GEK89576.1 hypothetical protein APU01nite_16150 [Alkalibacterium putridalgicola]SEL94966.1 Calcineurin-like phosphoesterase [Alkalibacterium putridalgicola]
MRPKKISHKIFLGSGVTTVLLLGIAVFEHLTNSPDSSIEFMENKPEVAEVQPTTVPNRISVTFNGDTRTRMGFNWYTGNHYEDASVWISTSDDLQDPIVFDAEGEAVTSRYAERTEDGFFIFFDDELGYYTDQDKKGPEWTSGVAVGYLELTDETEYVYKALATDLEPDTTYYYQVGSESSGKSAVGKFTTSGETGDDFTFVQYTDTQNAYWNEHVHNEAIYGADTLEKAIDTADGPEFILHTGDVVETAEVEDEWVDIFSKSQRLWMQQPLAVAPGNHDEHALHEGTPLQIDAFNAHFNVPVTNDAIDGGSYYSFDYNGVHFVVANTNDNKVSADNPEGQALGEEQLNWIRTDIKRARDAGAEWVILSFHKPLYSRSYHSLADNDVQKVRDEFMQTIDELDVDLALQGHDHVFSRTEPLAYVSSEESVFNARVSEAGEIIEEENKSTYISPEGTIFVLPHAAGTKAYVDLYSRSLAYIHDMRTDLRWMTQENVNAYNDLFAFGGQPQQEEVFSDSYANERQSLVQSFAVYHVEDKILTVEMYEVSGDLSENVERSVDKVHEFEIIKE